MADKITTLKLSDNTKVYPNTKDQNIPDTIARVNDLNPIKEDINSLKTQVSSIDTKTQNITGVGTGTSMVGTLDVEGKLTAGGDAEVDGKLKVNEFSDIVDKDNQRLDNTFITAEGNVQTITAKRGMADDHTGKCLRIVDATSGEATNFNFCTDGLAMYGSDYSLVFMYEGFAYRSYKIYYPKKSGYLATINDIPTYYQHMVTIRGRLTDNRTAVTFNAIARTKTDINSLLTLSDVLGDRWFAVSGVTPDSDNSKTTPISIFIDKNIRDSHIVFDTLNGYGNLNITTISNLEITDKISAI